MTPPLGLELHKRLAKEVRNKAHSIIMKEEKPIESIKDDHNIQVKQAEIGKEVAKPAT